MRRQVPRAEEAHVVAPRYHCGKIVRLQTSWTESNPLQRFHFCPKRRNNGCSFFQWVDVEMPPREKALMGWLLRTMRDLEGQVERGKGRQRKLWFALLVSWGVLIIVSIFT